MRDTDRPTTDGDLQIWERSPALFGEDSEEYQAHRRKFVDLLQPRDLLEENWVAEIACQIWESGRYRKMVGSIVDTTKQKALVDLLFESGMPLVPGETRYQITELAFDYFSKKPTAVRRVESHLKANGIDLDNIVAEAVALRMSDIQRLHQMVAKTQARRDQTLKAFQRHREGLGPQLRTIVEQLEAESVHKAKDQSAAPKLAA